MNKENIIALRKNKTIYRDGDKCVKLFCKGYSKSDILNEALNQARIEEGTDLKISQRYSYSLRKKSCYIYIIS